MDNENTAAKAFSDLEQAEKQLSALDADFKCREAELKNRLEAKRAELAARYSRLETDFAAREKGLLEEIRALKENDARKSVEYEKLCADLAAAIESKQASESKVSQITIGMMELNARTRSAEAALIEKDTEIAYLKRALEEIRPGALKNAITP